jgi:hypothetical protein
MKLKPVLKKGSRGDAVVELQTLLNSMASVKTVSERSEFTCGWYCR